MVISRRAFLQAGIVSAGSVLLGAACALPAVPTGAPTAVPTAAHNAGVKLPTYQPQAGNKADLPASSDGMVDRAFINYPRGGQLCA
jgi:hypothetical protein